MSFKDPYFFNPLLDSFDTCIVIRYWSQVLPSVSAFHPSDLDVKVMDLENQGFSD